MLEHDKVGPYWLVADTRHARRYLRSYAMDPRKNKLMSEQGIMHKAASIGDLGTKGGVVTDGNARVLREDGSVIEGLYSAGNNAASVMGRTYPGPGSTIGPAVVFGLRAARQMARQGE